MAHVVGHYRDRLAILQAARRSQLLKFTAQRDPMCVNSVRVVLTLKDGAGNGFFRHADTCYMLEARRSLNIKVFLANLVRVIEKCFLLLSDITVVEARLKTRAYPTSET